MYLCCHLPFLCSPPWFRDSLARFWYFVADHIDEFVMKPAQRAAVRKNVDYFLRRLQLPGLFVPLFLVPGELKLMRKKGWVLSSVKMALQAMRCKPAIAWIVRHLRLSFGKRGVWADFINAKRICRDAVVQIDQRNEMRDSGAPGGPEQTSRGLAASDVACAGQTVEETLPCVGSLVDVSRCFRSSALQRSECTPVCSVAVLLP